MKPGPPERPGPSTSGAGLKGVRKPGESTSLPPGVPSYGRILDVARTPRTPSKVCCVFGCRNTELDSDKLFHPIPAAQQLCKLWVKASGRIDLINKTVENLNTSYFICDLHFEASDRYVKKLKPCAVPTQNLPHDILVQTKCTQTECSIPDPERKTTREEATQTYIPEMILKQERASQTSTSKKPRILNRSTMAPQGLSAAAQRKRKLLMQYKTKCKRRKILEAQQKRTKWLERINRLDLKDDSPKSKDSRVCSDHFDGSDMAEGRLKPDVVPHLELPRKRVPIVYAPDPNASGFLPTTTFEVKKEPTETMEVEVQMESESENDKGKSKSQKPLLTNETPKPINQPVITNPSTVTAIPQNFQIDYGVRTLVVDPLPQTPQPNTGFQIIKVEQIDPETDINPTRDNEKANKYRRFFKNATFSGVEQIDIAPTTINPLDNKSTVQVQTSKTLIDHMNKPLIKKFKEEIKQANFKLKNLENQRSSPNWFKQTFLDYCDVYLDTKISEAVKCHASLQDKYSGNRYSRKFKIFALDLYLSSSQSYKFLAKFFYMPSRGTIKRFNLAIKTGHNEHLIDKFKVKVDGMSDREKICAVCFDYTGLKKNLYYDVSNDYLSGIQEIDQVFGSEPAQFATLLMVRGLYSKWTQPISFAFVAQKTCYPALQVWVLKMIALLIDIGLNVKAFIADMNTEFLDFSAVTPTVPYFMVGDKKIYHVFDVPCLYRSARDDLLNYNFHFGSEVTKWNHILKVYEIDKEEELSLMPKITQDHVRPTGEEKEKVKLAVEVFSETVAAVINFHVKANLVPKKLKETAAFIAKMSKLYDLLTSQKTTCQHALKEAYKATKEQTKFLFETLEYLQTLEMKDTKGYPVEKQMNFVTGLTVTIKALTCLSEDLKAEGIPYILTKKLSNDCTDLYFAEARLKGGNSLAKLTAIRFTRAFHRLFLSSLVDNSKEGKSEVDLLATLSKISEFVKSDAKDDEPEPNLVRLPVAVKDYQLLWPVPSSAFRAGYLLMKSIEKHFCCMDMTKVICDHYNLEYQNDTEGIKVLQDKCKEYKVANMKKKVTPPPEFLVEFVETLDDVYNDYYRNADVEPYGFGWKFFEKIEHLVIDKPCKCFPFRYFKFLFIRMKIFHTVKEYNVTVNPIRRRRGR